MRVHARTEAVAAGGATSEHSAPKPRAKPKGKAAATPVEATRASDLAKTKLDMVLRQRGDAQAWALRVSPCDLGAEMSAKFDAHANKLTEFYTELQQLVIQRCEDSARYDAVYARLDPQLEPAQTDAGGTRRGGGGHSRGRRIELRSVPIPFWPPSPPAPNAQAGCFRTAPAPSTMPVPRIPGEHEESYAGRVAVAMEMERALMGPPPKRSRGAPKRPQGAAARGGPAEEHE
jgi:hypothetical protein